LFLACTITRWSEKSTIPERHSSRYAFASLLLTAFGWSHPLQRYSNFLSHHSSHQLQPVQQYFSLTPFHHSSSSSSSSLPNAVILPCLHHLQLLLSSSSCLQLQLQILPCLHHLQLRYSHLMPTERFIDLIRPHTVAEVSHHRR